MRHYGLFVNGGWAPAGEEPVLQAANPYTGKAGSETRDAQESEVGDAVAAAVAAQPGCAAKSGASRALGKRFRARTARGWNPGIHHHPKCDDQLSKRSA